MSEGTDEIPSLRERDGEMYIRRRFGLFGLVASFVEKGRSAKCSIVCYGCVLRGIMTLSIRLGGWRTSIVCDEYRGSRRPSLYARQDREDWHDGMQRLTVQETHRRGIVVHVSLDAGFMHLVQHP